MWKYQVYYKGALLLQDSNFESKGEAESSAKFIIKMLIGQDEYKNSKESEFEIKVERAEEIQETLSKIIGEIKDKSIEGIVRQVIYQASKVNWEKVKEIVIKERSENKITEITGVGSIAGTVDYIGHVDPAETIKAVSPTISQQVSQGGFIVGNSKESTDGERADDLERVRKVVDRILRGESIRESIEKE